MKSRQIKRIGKALKKAAPTILSCLAGVGVIGVGVLVAKETPEVRKTVEKEQPDTLADKAKIYAKGYWPAIAVGAVTIGCIGSSAFIVKRASEAALASGALLADEYRKYRQATRENCDEETYQKIIHAVRAEDMLLGVQSISMTGSIGIDPQDEDWLTFYDEFSGRMFESRPSQVLEAEYHLNRNYILGKDVSPCDFYEFLGIQNHFTDAELAIFEDYHWWPEDEIQWIDFDHKRYMTDDGFVYYSISMLYTPRTYFPEE